MTTTSTSAFNRQTRAVEFVFSETVSVGLEEAFEQRLNVAEDIFRDKLYSITHEFARDAPGRSTTREVEVLFVFR